ncbi:Appr-1-p processing protein [Paenibacillus ferrarius]|uniref:Appr-1-p processing protein n=1 Tax=Paenibacillus ferrarius TaxID=1469647 RepID=A0A1V4HTH4_9BACL|nr:macro domain-containing protein [Paenibacillus ferrarius]OPH62187.1 Appr-1-p processing protein [Paenibacillus ferrarius]
MTIKVIEGDLLSAEEDIIAHQVNCMGVMGSGIAKVIRNKYPEVYDQYLNEFKGKSKIELLGECQVIKTSVGKYVANLFGQFNFGGDGKKYTDEEALKGALISLKEFAVENGLSVALPFKIGSDRGGADWNVVYGIIGEVFAEYSVTLYRL